MKQLGHGANVAEMAALYGKEELEIIDFSSNINPYTVPNLEDYLEAALDAAVSYPDSHYTKLRTEIATYLGVKPEQVIPGNGATEIMYLLMKSIKGTLGVFNPTFSEYERSAKLSGLKVVDLYLNEEKGFSYEEDELSALDAIFICNPNNPTGNVQALEGLLKQLNHQLLIVDETFMEFVEEESAFSLVPFIKDYPNLIIIKAITKFYGLPGLRLGYGVTSNVALLKQMYEYKEPWTVNSFANELTGYMLQNQDYIEASKSFFKEERAFMVEALKKLSGLKVYETDTNFILLKLKTLKAQELKERLFVKYDLLIRDASNFKGLDQHFVRVAIKTRAENELLIKALKGELNELY